LPPWPQAARCSPDGNHANAALDQIREQCKQAIKFAVGPAEFDCYVASLNMTHISQALTDCSM
jgi:hypothetical protein